jgi:hypothetical protein
MVERKIYSVNLNNVSKSDLAFVEKFNWKSKEVLEHLIKNPYGVLEVDYIDTISSYGLVSAMLKPM